MSKTITKSKTFWVNLVIVVAGAVSGALDTEVIANNPAYVAYAAAATGVINIILRILTKQSIT